MSHAMTTTSRSGCGCGCGGSSSGGAMRAGNSPGTTGSCGCGGSCGGKDSCGGGLCRSQDFARPRFFAGQLLTEEDLDLLTTYVVEKNRLHNRSLFGPGVVCGLTVTCDPCGGGKVTVQSGYALDCCGNDIVVPCPQSLDINALVRKLRIEKTGGVDCGDPCAQHKAKPVEPPQTKTGKDSEVASSQAIRAYDPKKDPSVPTPPPTSAPLPSLPAAEYCLYVRYCEQLTDPVSPYATDDPCGAQACEPTRVREGYRFELRCRTCDETAPENLFSRLEDCLGNLFTAEETARSARAAHFYGTKLSNALHWLSMAPATDVLDERRASDVALALERVTNLPEPPKSWSASEVFEASEAALSLASFVAAWHATKQAGRTSLATPDKLVQAAQDSLVSLERKIRAYGDPTSSIEGALDHDLTSATLESALLWKDPKTAMSATSIEERELLIAGVVFTRAVSSSLGTWLARIKANLADRLHSRTVLNDCRLVEDLHTITLPGGDANAVVDRADAVIAYRAIARLEDTLLRCVREGLCDAVNPPCLPCDDPAVLLACLRVEGCEVVDICNLERSFVLTPTAVRYWMPFLRSIGNALERLCCADDPCDTPPKLHLGTASDAAGHAERAVVSRSEAERRSALDLTTRWLGHSRKFDPSHLTALLPPPLSFSADNARRMAYSAASVLDIATLRRGVDLGGLLGIAAHAPRAVKPVAAPPAPASGPGKAAADFNAIRTDLEKMRKYISEAKDRNVELEARVLALEKRT